MLTSGSIQIALPPNDDRQAGHGPIFETNAECEPGDSDLDSILQASGVAGFTTHDYCYLEFDITPSSSQLNFNYVFASEEYPEYVCTAFNDVFGLFISGPGIVGKENLAVVPGTNTPVAINTVNSGSQGANAGDTTGVGCKLGFSEYYIENVSDGTEFTQYDGYTVLLSASTSVIPCLTYTLKLAVADVFDCGLDSGIFIEGKSLCSPDILAFNLDSLAIEGCDTGYILITRGCNGLDTAKTVTFSIGGNATNGIDYEPVDSIVDFPVGVDSIWIPIIPLGDNVLEGRENIIFSFINECTNTSYDLKVNIFDSIPLSISPADTSICFGDSVSIEIKGGDNYIWLTESPVEDSASTFTFAPDSSISIILEITQGACTDTASSLIRIHPIPNIMVKDTFICSGMSVLIQPFPLDSFLEYSWFPLNEYLNFTNTDKYPTFSRSTDSLVINEYTLRVGDSIGCTYSTNFIITTAPYPFVEVGNDTIILPEQSVHLKGRTNVDTFRWLPTDFLSNPEILDPVSAPDSTILYILEVINGYGCVNYDSILVKVVHTLLQVPSAFSPNGDGLNDEISLFNEGIKDLIKFEIYDRWGNLVFSSNNINKAWTGTNKSGIKEIGTYLYEIEATTLIGERIVKSGQITLIR